MYLYFTLLSKDGSYLKIFVPTSHFVKKKKMNKLGPSITEEHP